MLSEGEEISPLIPKLTWSQRMIGWIICYILGTFLTLFSFKGWSDLKIGKPATFATLFTLGNIITLASSFFWSGPKEQFKKMTDKTRLSTTIVYLTSMLITIYLCIWQATWFWLILLFIIIQWLALLWYSLSFIPYARSLILRVAENI